MDNNRNEQDGFAYTYSAKEQAEIRRIRDKYTKLTEAEDKMARLRRLDAGVTELAQAVSLILGVVGALMLGFGMSLCMSELAAMLGMQHTAAMVLGIIIGLFGAALAGLAYPVYRAIIKARRKKIAPEIIRLTDELMK